MTFVIGIVATLRSWKGHRYLIDAIGEMHRTRPAARTRLVIVGDGPQRQALEAQVRVKQALQQLVDLRGNQNDVIPLSAWPLTASHYRHTPMKACHRPFCRPWAVAVPVVTTDAGAIGEVAKRSAHRAGGTTPG